VLIAFEELGKILCPPV